MFYLQKWKFHFIIKTTKPFWNLENTFFTVRKSNEDGKTKTNEVENINTTPKQVFPEITNVKKLLPDHFRVRSARCFCSALKRFCLHQLWEVWQTIWAVFSPRCFQVLLKKNDGQILNLVSFGFPGLVGLSNRQKRREQLRIRWGIYFRWKQIKTFHKKTRLKFFGSATYIILDACQKTDL